MQYSSLAHLPLCWSTFTLPNHQIIWRISPPSQHTPWHKQTIFLIIFIAYSEINAGGEILHINKSGGWIVSLINLGAKRFLIWFSKYCIPGTGITTNPPLVYNLSLCCTDVMADNTDSLLTRDLMLDAVPNSSANILLTLAIWSFGGMINDIIDVPFLWRTSTKLIQSEVSSVYKAHNLMLKYLTNHLPRTQYR